MPSTNTRGAIVYLPQLRHSSYGRDSLGLLKRCAITHDRTQTHIIQTQQYSHAHTTLPKTQHSSVTLLFRNYNSIRRDDVLFFHTGDIPLTAQADVLALCAGSRVVSKQEVQQSLPTPQQLAEYGRKSPDAPGGDVKSAPLHYIASPHLLAALVCACWKLHN